MPAAQKARPAHMTFSIPEPVKKRAQARRDVNWSAVVAHAIEERLRALELMDRVLVHSRITQKDVDDLSDLIDNTMAKRHGLVK